MASPLGNLRSVVLRRVLFEPSVKARSILALSSSQSVQNNNLMRRQKCYALISLKEQRLIKGVVVRKDCSSVHRYLCFCHELLFFERASDASAEHKSRRKTGTKIFVLPQGHYLTFELFHYVSSCMTKRQQNDFNFVCHFVSTAPATT